MSKHITEQEIDRLNEVCNIGAGNAVTSLSVLLDRRINMDIASIKILELCEITSILGEEDKYIAAMLNEVSGDIEGAFLLAFELESTKKFIKTMLNQDIEDVRNLDELAYSLLCETGNILGGTYLTALTTLTSLDTTQTPPQMTVDMAGAISTFTAMNFVDDEDRTVILEAKFTDKESCLSGVYILMIDNESFNKINEALDKLV